jgi:hypothetical protein
MPLLSLSLAGGVAVAGVVVSGVVVAGGGVVTVGGVVVLRVHVKVEKSRFCGWQ